MLHLDTICANVELKMAKSENPHIELEVEFWFAMCQVSKVVFLIL